MDRPDTLPDPIDRRREPRFAIGAKATLQRDPGDQYPAVTLNISSGGLLLKIEDTNPFAIGDQVVCEIALPDVADGAFAEWGIGHVVRIDHANAAIELRAGVFQSQDGAT